jgi:hypothetical protein
MMVVLHFHGRRLNRARNMVLYVGRKPDYGQWANKYDVRRVRSVLFIFIVVHSDLEQTFWSSE